MTKKHSYFQQRIFNLTLQGTGISSALHRPIRMVCKASSSLTNISADRALLFLYRMLCNPHFSQYFMCSPVKAMAKKWWEPFRMCWATPSCHSSQPSMSSLTHEGMFSVFHLVLDCTIEDKAIHLNVCCALSQRRPLSAADWLTHCGEAEVAQCSSISLQNGWYRTSSCHCFVCEETLCVLSEHSGFFLC